MRMRGKLHVILGGLFVLSLLYDFYAWGGLAKTPAMGPVVSDAASRELALASVYLPTGRALVDMAGLSASASQHAQEAFAPVQEHLLANPPAAMETVVNGMPPMQRAAYYGAPLLLLAFAIAYWRRPRVLHSMGSRR
jgi:hypothetical protein